MNIMKWYAFAAAHRWRMAAGLGLVVIALAGWWLLSGPSAGPSSEKNARRGRAPTEAAKVEVELSVKQAAAIQVAPVGRCPYRILHPCWRKRRDQLG
jgi:hypothetical protein